MRCTTVPVIIFETKEGPYIFTQLKTKCKMVVSANKNKASYQPKLERNSLFLKSGKYVDLVYSIS